MRSILETFDEVKNELFRLPDVTGIDIGLKVVAGIKTDRPAIRVFVRKKGEVPPAQRVPAIIDGHQTDVIERAFTSLVLQLPAAGQDLTTEAPSDPLVGGISFGPCRIVNNLLSAGTLGITAIDLTTGRPALVSNYHVFVTDGQYQIGDSAAQPSLLDGGTCPNDSVGQLTRVVFDGFLDGAVVSQGARATGNSIRGLDVLIGSGPAAIGINVRKSGRTTAVTSGVVESMNMLVLVDYKEGIGTHAFGDVIQIEPNRAQNATFAAAGDSGSVVVDENNWVVGLLFAVSTDGVGLAFPIDNVLKGLAIKLNTPPFGSQWVPVDGAAHDVAVGRDGSVWIVGTAPWSEYGCPIYRFNGNGGFIELTIPNAATRIAVDPMGNPWIVNSIGEIWRFDGQTFLPVAGGGRDIGIGADGSVWIVGTLPGDEPAQGNGIYKLGNSGFEKVPGAALRIAVDPNGNPWITQSSGNILRWSDGRFVPVAGGATDIGVGADGSVWLTGTIAYGVGFGIYRWMGGDVWRRVAGQGTSIAVDPAGLPWVTNSRQEIYRRI